MIIFDLDGTLADCSHRQHFVDPSKNPDAVHGIPPIQPRGKEIGISILRDYNKSTGLIWKPDWKSFFEACDKDIPIQPVVDTFIHLTQGEPFNHDVQIWSGRCESVREKTLKWLTNLTGYLEDYQYWDRRLKMRPIGDSTPDYMLKERWLDERIDDMGYQMVHDIDFVFDDRPKVVRMWRRRGIFVFNCCQHNEEF